MVVKNALGRENVAVGREVEKDLHIYMKGSGGGQGWLEPSVEKLGLGRASVRASGNVSRNHDMRVL